LCGIGGLGVYVLNYMPFHYILDYISIIIQSINFFGDGQGTKGRATLTCRLIPRNSQRCEHAFATPLSSVANGRMQPSRSARAHAVSPVLHSYPVSINNLDADLYIYSCCSYYGWMKRIWIFEIMLPYSSSFRCYCHSTTYTSLNNKCRILNANNRTQVCFYHSIFLHIMHNDYLLNIVKKCTTLSSMFYMLYAYFHSSLKHSYPNDLGATCWCLMRVK